MSLRRNLLMLAAYLGALAFMALPFAMIDSNAPPAAVAQAGQLSR